MKAFQLFFLFCVFSIIGYSQNIVQVNQINLANATTGWGTIHLNLSVNGDPLKIKGVTYADGVGVNSASEIHLNLNRTATRFQASVGLDDAVSPNSGNVEFKVLADNELVWSSGIMKNTDAIRLKTIDLDITGKMYLSLVVTLGSDGINWYDRANWVQTKITYSGNTPICIPKSALVLAPVITDKYFFIETGKLVNIPLNIKSLNPPSFTFANIPQGLTFNAVSKSLEGSVITTGVYDLGLKVWNADGADSSQLSISVMPPRKSPPMMGWCSWNNYRTNINETIIKKQADAMVSSGLVDAGYKYVNLDDGYFNGRNTDGTFKLDATKFPNGMKVVADYIHSKGLKAGFYSEAGANTCGSIYDAQTGGVGAGLYNHEQQDIDLFFKTWDFDFFKVDYCGALNQVLDEKTRYSAIKMAMDRTGKTDIVYNVCRWQFPGTWVGTIADSWRVSQDISPSWSSMTSIIDKNTFLAAYSSQGHYNDMDILEVGRGMSAEEDKSQFSMWCILSAPLALGNDLTTMTQQTKTILTNTEVIAVDQDTTGVQGRLVTDNGAGLQVWAKNLNGKLSKERAVVLFNRSATAASMSVKWSDLNLTGSATVRDLWSHTDLGSMTTGYTVTVPSHGVVMLKVVGEQSKLQEVFEAEYGWINNYNLTQNTVVLADQGRPVTDASCSGRAKVTFLGNNEDNWIEFRDVFAAKSGEYTLSISYISSSNRNATLSVNGIETQLTNLISGGVIAVVKVPVSLKAGSNTIRLSNATGWLPDLDKISLDVNANSTGMKITTSKDIKLYPNPAENVLTVEAATAPINAQLSICNLLGQVFTDMPMNQNRLSLSLTGYADGIYMLKMFESGDVVYQSKFVVCRK